MIRFILGLGTGLYIGTYYNCKPIINKVIETMKKNIPAKSDDDDDDEK